MVHMKGPCLAAYEHLNRRVPDACKFDLHVLLVEHGKVYKNDVKWLKQAVGRGNMTDAAELLSTARAKWT